MEFETLGTVSVLVRETRELDTRDSKAVSNACMSLLRPVWISSPSYYEAGDLKLKSACKRFSGLTHLVKQAYEQEPSGAAVVDDRVVAVQPIVVATKLVDDTDRLPKSAICGQYEVETTLDFLRARADIAAQGASTPAVAIQRMLFARSFPYQKTFSDTAACVARLTLPSDAAVWRVCEGSSLRPVRALGHVPSPVPTRDPAPLYEGDEFCLDGFLILYSGKAGTGDSLFFDAAAYGERLRGLRMGSRVLLEVPGGGRTVKGVVKDVDETAVLVGVRSESGDAVVRVPMRPEKGAPLLHVVGNRSAGSDLAEFLRSGASSMRVSLFPGDADGATTARWARPTLREFADAFAHRNPTVKFVNLDDALKGIGAEHLVDAMDVATRDLLAKLVPRVVVIQGDKRENKPSKKPVPKQPVPKKRGGSSAKASGSIVEAVESDARRTNAFVKAALEALDVQTKTLERCPESCKRILERHLSDVKGREAELSTWRPSINVSIQVAPFDATPDALFEFEAKNVERDPKDFFGQGQLVSAASALEGLSYEDAGHYRVVPVQQEERRQVVGDGAGLPSGEAMLRIALARLDMLRAVPKATQKRMLSLAEYATPAEDAFGNLEKTLRELAKRQGQIMEQVRRRGLKYKTYEEFAKQYEQAQRTLYVKRYMASVYASFFVMIDSFLQHGENKQGRLRDLPAVSGMCSSGKTLEKVVTCMVQDVLLNNKAPGDKDIESAVNNTIAKVRAAMSRSFFRKVAEFEAIAPGAAAREDSMALAAKHRLPRASKQMDPSKRIILLTIEYDYDATKPSWVFARSRVPKDRSAYFFAPSELSASRTERDVADVASKDGAVEGMQLVPGASDNQESLKDVSKFAEDFDAALGSVVRRDDDAAWGKLHDDVQQRLAKLQGLGGSSWLTSWVAAVKNDDADSRQASKAVSLKAFVSYWLPAAMTALVRGRPVARLDPDLAQRLSNQTDKYKQVLLAIGSMARGGRVVFEVIDRQYKKSVAALHVLALCLELLHKDDVNRRLSVELAGAMVEALSWYAKFNDYKDGEWKDTLARQNEAIKERKIRLEQNLSDEDKAALQEFKKVRKEKYDGSVERMLEGMQTLEEEDEFIEESAMSEDQVMSDADMDEQNQVDENDNDEDDDVKEMED